MRSSPGTLRAAGLVAALIACAAVAASSSAGAVHATAESGAPRTAPRQQNGVDRTVQDRQIAEISGMVASVRHPGSVWVHEDSGRPAVVYAIARNGETQAALTVRGVKAVDWEAMATARDSAGRRVLAIGDIGDNGAVRREIEIIVVREPARLRDATVAPVRRIRLRYPDEASDAEALLADPRTGRLYVVTKSLVNAELFAVPQAAWPGAGPDSRVWTLEPVARLETAIVTDGAFLPDGRMVLRNYGSMAVFPAPAPTTDSVRSLASSSLPDQPQGEAIAVTADGRSALLGSEGSRQPILRVTVPAAAIAQASTSPTPTRVGAGTADNAQVAEDEAAEEDSALPSLLVQVMLIALGVLMLIFTVVVLALR